MVYTQRICLVMQLRLSTYNMPWFTSNGSGRIRKEVLAAVEEKIENAEASYSDMCIKLDAQYQEDVARLHEGVQANKESHLKALVAKVLNS